MVIPTTRILRNASRRLDRRQRRHEQHQKLADEAAALMRDHGLVLHLTHRPNSNIWWLGGDHPEARELPAEAVTFLLQHSNLVPVDGGLLEGCPQCWRWCED
jgi:hypothetical protein